MNLKLSRVLLFLVMCFVYGASLLYSSNMLLREAKEKQKYYARGAINSDREDITKINIVDVSGTAIYLWVNILGGAIKPHHNDGWLKDELKIGRNHFTYHLGVGNFPNQTIPLASYENIVIAVNGRTPLFEKYSENWILELIHLNVTNIGVLLLGSEQCNNKWIHELKNTFNAIKIVFLVYDDVLVDNDLIFQWPLGVAGYRNFGSYDETLNFSLKRKYFANFVGTVYNKSSRAELLEGVKNYNKNSLDERTIFTKIRREWEPKEKLEAMAQYKHILLNSDFTLSPVGMNTECYRTYEAFELGSIPIVEDVVTNGNCDKSAVSPYRFLKKYKPPIHFIKSWDKDLPPLLKSLALLSDDEILELRMNLVNWYKKFKEEMKQYFLLNMFQFS